MTSFAQNGSEWKKFVTLTDSGTPGNILFNGSVIYCFANDMTFSGNVHNSTLSIMNPSPAPDYPGSNVGSVWKSLINNVSFSGVDNHIIKLSGTWTTDLGSSGTTGSEILTPYKIMLMSTSGRTFYLKDERIIEQMILESGSQLYNENGLPVVVMSYDLKASRANNISVNWSLTLREDKV